MTLTSLKLRPGLVSIISPTSNEGGWRDGNLVRFRAGFPQPIGGWLKNSSNAFLGINRTLHNWVSLAGNDYMAVGTSKKYYIEEGGAYNDITPIRSTVTLGTDPFDPTNGSPTVIVTHVSHGALDGDFVTFSGASTYAGFSSGQINTEFALSLIDNDTYSITMPQNANSGSVGGGAAVDAEYQINSGSTVTVGGGGWGAGTWGRGTWGSGTDLNITNILRVWSQDNFGEDLIFCANDGQIFYWDKTGGVSTRAVTLESLSADTTVPTIAKQVLVSDKDRHVIVFGCDNGDGDQDPMLIRFSDGESPFVWENLVTNEAGEFRLGSGSYIIRAVETKREIIIFTDTALYSMQFIGPPDIFGIQQVASNVSSKGRLVHVAVDDSIYWMGRESFYVYDGRVTQILCPIKDDVFNDITDTDVDKIIACHNSEFMEIMWFYPSSGAMENDHYVAYNYMEQTWSKGVLGRSGWIDRGVRSFPQATTTDGYQYNHEIGFDDGSTSPVSSLEAYVESAPIDIGEGDQFMFINRIIPDIMFLDSTAPNPTADFVVKTSRFPGSTYNETTTSTTTRISTTPIDQYTEQIHIRQRGRSMVLKVQSTVAGVTWTLGTPRVDVRPDGRR